MTLSLFGTTKTLNLNTIGYLRGLATESLGGLGSVMLYEVRSMSASGSESGQVMIQNLDTAGLPSGVPSALPSAGGMSFSTMGRVTEMANGSLVYAALHYTTPIEGGLALPPAAIYVHIPGGAVAPIKVAVPADLVVLDYALYTTENGFSVTVTTAPNVWPYTADPVDTIQFNYDTQGLFLGQKVIENGPENSKVLDTLTFNGTAQESTPLKDWALISKDDTSAVIHRTQNTSGGNADDIALSLGGAPLSSVVSADMAELSDGRVAVALEVAVYNPQGSFNTYRTVLQVVDPSTGTLNTLSNGETFLVLEKTAFGIRTPKVTALQSGTFVLTYISDVLRAQEYGADGNPIGNNLFVSGTASSNYTVDETAGGLIFQWGEYTGPVNNIKTQFVQFSSTVTNTINGTINADVLHGADLVDDTIYGLAGNDTLLGKSGFDTLDGGDGNDFISGGANDDVINGGAGDDVILGGTGADTIKGGTGWDVASYEDSQTAIRVDPSFGVLSDGASDSLTDIEAIWGSNLADTIFASGTLTTIKGLGGDDVINGGVLDDWIVGGEGADRIWGNLGLDTISYADSGAGVQVNLITGTGTGGTAQGDVLGGVEHIVGSNFNDTLTGNEWALNMFGEGGNDTLIGGLKDNILDGGAGNDILMGGAGNDSLWGGSGIDTASYRYSATAVTVNLATGSSSGGDAQGDIFWNVENLIGSNFADTLTGSAWTQRLDGGAGNDTLRGGSGNNTLLGSAGADKLYGEAGHDAMTGGTGSDTLSGGIGNDSFIYNTLTEGGDTITDFSSFANNNNDVFRFKGSVFGGLAVGGISGAQFQSGTSHVAGTTDIRFFYETDTQVLRFDADGSGGGAAVIIATLQTGATMTFDDIAIF